MSAAELLPCPFCGDAPSISTSYDENIWDHSQVEYTRISCSDCGVSVDWPTHHEEVDGEPYSVTQWNTRTDAILSDPRASASVLLEMLDDIWTPQASTAMDNARTKAERDGHKYRVIDREGFRAALAAIKEATHEDQ